MTKKNLKSEIAIILRGIKLVHKIMSKYIPCMFVYVFFSTLPKYTNIFFSAKIIDEIIGYRRFNVLIAYVLVMVFISFAFTLISKLSWRYVRVNQIISGDWEDIYLNQKSFNLDFEQIENYKIRQLRQQIEDSRNIGGLNILIIKLMVLFQNVLNLLLSSIMMIGIVFDFSDGIGTHKGEFVFADSWWSIFVLIVLTISLSIILAKSTQKACSKKALISKEMSLIQKKSHFYINEYLGDSKTGKDVRIFEQRSIIIETAKEMIDTFLESNKCFVSIQFETDKKIAFLSLLLNTCVYIIMTIKTLAGSISLGVMIKYISLTNQFLHNILCLSDSIIKLQENNIYLKLLYEYLDYESKMKSGSKCFSQSYCSQKHTIKFHNVSFKYPQSEEYVLKNISFEINSGEHLAIVGMNGCGKTTIIKLLCRLYDTTDGIITIDGENIKNYSYSEWLGLFSVVFQDFRLFPLSVAQNIASNIIYDENKVINCIDSIGIAKLINSFSDGLNTNIYKTFDESGAEISGGESQKIAIARALYKDSPFIILDEPTAALDPISESEIYSNFNKITKNKTSILISHRLSSCKFCDKIIVLEKGEIVQIGEHNSLLLDEQGLYHKLWNAQAQYYKD